MKKEKIKKEKTEEPPSYTITAQEYSALAIEKRSDWLPIKGKYEKIPIICFVCFGLLLFSLAVYAVACLSPVFADFVNTYISQIFRFLLAKVSNLLPFSIAEAIIILLPIIGFIAIWYLMKFRCHSKRSSRVAIVCILAVTATILSSFVLCFGIAYKGTSLDNKLELNNQTVSPEELYETADHLMDKINVLADEIQFSDSGFSVMPYSFAEMNSKLLDAYDKFCSEYSFMNNFRSRLKPIMLSEPMSYTHITGVYTFFTGESNLNVNFPDYTIPYTAAHELAHQRGIAREDEANMVAFLVCIGSDDPYIQYSAYVNVYEYVSSALYKASKDLYKKVDKNMDSFVLKEQIAYSKFFDKYEKSVASVVTGAVNDVYLKAQGTVGKKSYGMVVDLTVAYYKKLGIVTASNE